VILLFSTRAWCDFSSNVRHNFNLNSNLYIIIMIIIISPNILEWVGVRVRVSTEI